MERQKRKDIDKKNRNVETHRQKYGNIKTEIERQKRKDINRKIETQRKKLKYRNTKTEIERRKHRDNRNKKIEKYIYTKLRFENQRQTN